MKKAYNVILCGLGAIGSIYAEKFSKCPLINFNVLLDDTRLNKYSNTPIILNDKELPLNYITQQHSSYEADLIIIATKISGYNSALEETKNFVGKSTIILPLLNGVTSEEIAASYFGWEHVLFGYFIGHSAVRNKNIITHDGIGRIVFGSETFADNRVKRVKDIFDLANIQYEIPKDIKFSMWKKFILNVSSNPTTALFRLTFGELLNNPYAMHFAEKIMQEVISIAKAEGIKNTDMLYKDSIKELRNMLPEGKTSMLQDIEADRKTENEIFAQTIVKLGAKHGIDTPYCSILNEMFTIIDYEK